MTGLSAGSKTIYTVGAAVLQAAEDARRQTFEIAAAELEASVHDLEHRRTARSSVRGMPDKGITLATIGKKGNLYMSKTPPVLGKAHPAFTQQAPAFAAQLARIEVDPDTGEVTLHDFVIVQDVGQGHQPARGRGPDAGRRGAEPRHRAHRGADVRRQRAAHQPEPARLPQAHRGRPAEHRDDHRRGARAGRPLRRPRRRRAADRPGARRDRQRDPGRDRRAPHRAAA